MAGRWVEDQGLFQIIPGLLAPWQEEGEALRLKPGGVAAVSVKMVVV